MEVPVLFCQEMCWSCVLPVILHGRASCRFSGVYTWVALHRPCQAARLTVSCLLCECFVPWNLSYPFSGWEKKRPRLDLQSWIWVVWWLTNLQTPMVPAYYNSPLTDMGEHWNVQCLGFLRKSLCHSCSHPFFLEEREDCRFLWGLVPHKGNVQPVQCSPNLPPRGKGRMCSSPLYGHNMDHYLLAQPGILVDDITSWIFSQARWSKPISLNQYLETLLAEALGYFLASKNIETPLTYLWFYTLSPTSTREVSGGAHS